MDDRQASPTDAATDAAPGPPVEQPSSADDHGKTPEVERLQEQLEAERELRRAAQQLLRERARGSVTAGPLDSTGPHFEPPRTDATRPGVLRDGANWQELAQGAASSAILLGIGLYGSVRFGHQVFCDQLGVRPEDIGLTYPASVSRAAVVLVALATPFGLLAGLLVLGRTQGPRLPEPIKFLAPLTAAFVGVAGGLILGSAVVAVGLFLSVFVGIALFPTFVYFGILIGLAVIGGIVTSVRHRRRDRWPSQAAGRSNLEQRPHRDQRRWRHDRAAVLLLACLMTAAAFIVSGWSANTAAEYVKEGRDIPGKGALTILGLRAVPVLATGELADDLDLSSRQTLYLGHGDGSVVIYDVRAQRPVLLPAEGTTIVFPPVEETTTPNAFPQVTFERVLRDGYAVDFDSMIDHLGLPGHSDPGVAQANLLQHDNTFELAIQHGEIVPPTILGSKARIARVTSEAPQSRSTCTRTTASTERLNMPLPVSKLRTAEQLCIHTSAGRWILLRVVLVEQSPTRLTLTLIAWPA